MATGKAAVLDQPMGTFRVEEFQVPDPEPGTVLLRQELAGCCATDAHTYLGQWQAEFPVIMGHENVGVIDDSVYSTHHCPLGPAPCSIVTYTDGVIEAIEGPMDAGEPASDGLPEESQIKLRGALTEITRTARL